MRRSQRVGAAVAVVAAVMVLAGCGDSSDSGSSRGDGKPSVSASVSPTAASVAPRDALAEYEQETASGCTDATDCQEFMTRKLAAAVRVRDAMQAENPALYAVPIGYVDEAVRQADHFGRDNLAAKGNMLAVATPIQRMVAWFREHPEG